MWAILGHSGCLEFFDVELLGHRREAQLTPNDSFTGQSIIRQPNVPGIRRMRLACC
jgi:hypothetical protein